MRARFLLAIASLVLATSACSGEATPTASTTTAPSSTTVDQLEAELVAVRQQLLTSESDREELEATVSRLETDLASAHEQARSAIAGRASAVESLDNLESLLVAIRVETCPGTQPPIPAEFADQLMAWLIDTEAGQGSIPPSTAPTLSRGVTGNGWWLFTAEFNQRFQAGLFVRNPDGDFASVWGGIGSSEAGLRAWIYGAEPALPVELVLCADVGEFIESP